MLFDREFRNWKIPYNAAFAWMRRDLLLSFVDIAPALIALTLCNNVICAASRFRRKSIYSELLFFFCWLHLISAAIASLTTKSCHLLSDNFEDTPFSS